MHCPQFSTKKRITAIIYIIAVTLLREIIALQALFDSENKSAVSMKPTAQENQ